MAKVTDKGAIQRHFWGWDQPVLHKAAEWLMQGWAGGELNLDGTLILTATAEAGRRLREELAKAAAEKNGAVFAPNVWPPEVTLTWNLSPGQTPSRVQRRLAWASVLEGIEGQKFATLFPILPQGNRDDWAVSVAETLMALQESVGGGGKSFADIAESLKDGTDAQRWNELAALHQAYDAALAKMGLRDTQALKREASQNGAIPEGVTQIVVFAVAELPMLVRDWLRAVAKKLPVKIFIQAPEEEAGAFDDLGMPETPLWSGSDRHIELGEAHLHLLNDGAQQAGCAINLVRAAAGQGKRVGIGVCDVALTDPLKGAFAAESVHAFDPAGEAASRHALLEVLKRWRQFSETGNWKSFSVFIRQSDVLSVVADGLEVRQEEVLELVDDFFAERIPPSLELAISLSQVKVREGRNPEEQARLEKKRVKLQALLTGVKSRMDRWRREKSLTQALRAILEWLYGERAFHANLEQDQDYMALLGEALQLAAEVEEAAQHLGHVSSLSQQLSVVLTELAGVSLPERRTDVDLVLYGWLELLWEPAETLVLCGFNDEAVPGKPAVDAFLPDHVREGLGLPCQASRRARDAYLLSAIAGQRPGAGRLHLVLGQTSQQGDVLRPSRLLFACDDEVLLERVRTLFPEKTQAGSTKEAARQVAWKLKPRRVEGMVTKVSVSLLTSYLNCPLRCYFERFLHMESPDAGQREMTAGDFGNLIHDSLRILGDSDELREGIAEPKLRELLSAELARLAKSKWGTQPFLSTAIQIETAERRLEHLSTKQVELYQQGWRIQEIEYDFGQDGALLLGGLPFKGRMDRVDVMTAGPDKGALRIWDYKTRSKAGSPAESHCKKVSDREQEANPDNEWRWFEGADGTTQNWLDLQLPLYVWAAQQIWKDAPRIEVGYAHLPAAVTDTEYQVWTELDAATVDAAVACAEEIIRRMQAGIFWPPVERRYEDDFSEILLQDAASSVDPVNLLEEATVE